MKYTITCLQGAPFSSWSEPRDRNEIIEQFRDYAEMDEWEEIPPKRAFTMRFISEMWQVRFERVKDV